MVAREQVALSILKWSHRIHIHVFFRAKATATATTACATTATRTINTILTFKSPLYTSLHLHLREHSHHTSAICIHRG